MLLLDEATLVDGEVLEAHGAYHVRGDEFFCRRGTSPATPWSPA